LAHARADVDAALAGNLVEVKHPAPLEHTKVNRVFTKQCQSFELRSGDARQIELVADTKPELEQFGSEAIATTRHKCQIAPVRQGGRQAVGRAAREAKSVGEIAERDRPLGGQL